MPRGDVYLSDLLVIADQLSVQQEDVLRELLPMLHLDRPAALPKPPREPGLQRPIRSAGLSTPRTPARPAAPVGAPEPTPAGTAPPRTGLLMRLRRGSAAQRPTWAQTGQALEPESEPTALAVPALIEPRRRTAILSTALATHVPEGRPLMEAVVRAIARARVLMELPRRSRPTLRRGVQLLVDVGDGMIPFDSDVQSLVEGVRRCASRSKTEVRYFTGSPLRQAGSGAEEGWGPWSPPSRGTPILLLTDLGLGGPALSTHRAYPAEWLQFAARARHAGCPLVALVPYPPRRWPRALRRHFILLQWDRALTVGSIRQQLRQHRGGGGV